MIAIIDYDAGNIKSVEKALLYLGQEVKITSDPSEILSADKVILPGVGAFGDAMEKLKERHLDDVIRKVTEKGTPFLGICLGLQLLFERSDEAKGVEGLGILEGEICRIPACEGLKIPHMGWNSLHLEHNGRLFKNVDEQAYVYFVHSYAAKCDDDSVAAYCDYGGKVTALVYDGKYVIGTQFHPEKSGKAGLKMLKNFSELV